MKILIVLLFPLFSIAQRQQANYLFKATSDRTFAWINPTALPVSTATQSALDLKLSTATAASTYQTALGFTPYNATNPSGYLVVADIAGKLNSNGSAALLTNFPTLNQNTSGSAASLSAPLSFANGGIGGGAATSATTGTINVSMPTEIITCTPTGAMQLNAVGGVAGQRITFVFSTSGASSFVITFGTGFFKTGTLATGVTTARKFAVSFIFDGTNWIEFSRTAVQS